MNIKTIINNRLKKLAENNEVLPTYGTTQKINQNRNLLGQPPSSKVNNNKMTGNTKSKAKFTKALKNKSFKNNVGNFNIKSNINRN